MLGDPVPPRSDPQDRRKAVRIADLDRQPAVFVQVDVEARAAVSADACIVSYRRASDTVGPGPGGSRARGQAGAGEAAVGHIRGRCRGFSNRLFGGLGIFHSERASAASGAVTVEYPGLTRHTATTELQITTGTAAVSEGEVMLTLSSDWVDGADIDRVIPEPDTWESTSDGLRLTFAAEQAPPEVRISYRPDVIGLHSGTVSVGESGPEVGFRQFVYP